MKAGLLFISGQLVKDGRSYRGNSIMNMYMRFSSVFEIDLICPLSEGVASAGYCINLSSFNLYPLKAWRNWQELYLLKFPSFLWRIVKLFITKRRYWDFIWITDYMPETLFCVILAKIYKIPIVLYLRGDKVREIEIKDHIGLKGFFSKLYCFFYRKTLPIVLKNCITVVTGNELYNKYKNEASKIFQFTASAITRKDLKSLAKQTKLDSNDYLKLIYVGNLVDYKGVDVLIRSIAQLRSIGVNCKVEIIGTGPSEQMLRTMVRNLKLDTNIIFRGFVPFGQKLFSLYKSCDVYVLPSFTEGTPKTIAEAMACGLPVIATEVGGLPEMIDNEVNGLLVKPGSVKELSNAILRLSNDRELLNKMSKSALAKAEIFTVDYQLEILRDFLISALLSLK